MNSVIFSQESEFGDTGFAALDGMTITQFGAALVPANLSARQAAALGLTTSGTCGPRGSTSLRSAALQESLASRLQAKTDSAGSILYQLTWKTRVTPSGRRICALRGSPNKAALAAAFICDSAYISPQPAKGWTTPVTNDAEKRGAVDPMRGNGLAGQGNQAGWATPLTNATKDTGDLEAYLHGPNGRFRNDATTTQAILAGWPTPNAGDEKWRYSNPGVVERRAESGKQLGLEAVAMLSTVPANCTAFLIATPDGRTQISYIAATGGGVQLNPAHSRWLMRFPVQWEQCAPNYWPYATLQALASAT